MQLVLQAMQMAQIIQLATTSSTFSDLNLSSTPLARIQTTATP
jgi:hypothetical protein